MAVESEAQVQEQPKPQQEQEKAVEPEAPKIDLGDELKKSIPRTEFNRDKGLARQQEKTAALTRSVEKQGESIDKLLKLMGNQQAPMPSLEGVDMPDGKALESRFKAGEQKTQTHFDDRMSSLESAITQLQTTISNSNAAQPGMSRSDLESHISETAPDLKGHEKTVADAFMAKLQSLSDQGLKGNALDISAEIALGAIVNESRLILAKEGPAKVDDVKSDKNAKGNEAAGSTKIVDKGATPATNLSESPKKEIYASKEEAIQSILRDKLLSRSDKVD